MLWVCRIWPLLCWGRFLLCLLFGAFFNHEWVLYFVKSFLCIYLYNHMTFIFQFIDMVNHTDWSAYVEKSLHPWDKSYLFMVYDPLMCCWILFAKILLRIFASVFISGVGLQFSFFVWCFYLVLVPGWWWLHRKSLKVFLLQFFGRVWEG